MTDTRQHERYDIRVSAEVTVSQGEPVTCLTRDLSLGGVGIECEWPLPEDIALQVELFVVVDDIEDEGTVPLHLDGKVVWCRQQAEREFLAGIQFGDLSDEQKTVLTQLVSATSAS